MVRVDNVPLLLRPLFWLYSWFCALLLLAYTRLVHATCTITFNQPSPPGNCIYCIWHESLAPFFCVYNDMSNQVWMNHPAWFMKPIHILLRLSGVKHLCLGSTGNSGKEAMAGVISFLNKGYTTTIASDGPAGPAHQLKPGVLLMSAETGVPVIALRFVCNHSMRLCGWDKKIVPRLFSTIKVEYSMPIIVQPDRMEVAQKAIEDWLNFA